MHILAKDIQSQDGIANSAIQEAGDRLIEQHETILELGRQLVIMSNAAERYQDERDALQARIDGGIRVYAGRGFSMLGGIWADTVNKIHDRNAILILDDEVEL